MAELQPLKPETARTVCADKYASGLRYFRQGALSNTWRTVSTLYAAVAGSASAPYEVSVSRRDDGTYAAHCTCPAARRQQGLCKHAAAMLIAWAEKPAAFPLHAEPAVANGDASGLKAESEAKRMRWPKEDRQALIAAGLDKAEALLVDLCAQGLLAVTKEQVAMVGSLAETLAAHKLRRLARQVAALQAVAATAESGEGFAEADWARLLADTWFILTATRKALAKEDEADRAELEELVGKTWLEKDLRRVENLRLLELAHQTDLRATGFRIDASYLLDLADGTLYVEKLITPLQRKDTPKKRSYALPLKVAAAGVYPGFAPWRLKLIEAAEEADAGDAWERAIALAETSATALRQKLIQATASPVAPPEAYGLFRPATVLVARDAITLVDAEGKALPVGGANALAAAYGLRGALCRGPLGAVFCRLSFTQESMVAEPLGVILPESADGERLVRLTA